MFVLLCQYICRLFDLVSEMEDQLRIQEISRGESFRSESFGLRWQLFRDSFCVDTGRKELRNCFANGIGIVWRSWKIEFPFCLQAKETTQEASVMQCFETSRGFCNAMGSRSQKPGESRNAHSLPQTLVWKKCQYHFLIETTHFKLNRY